MGLKPRLTEKSIQNAYIELIDKSEHFIYIENQFFVSSLAGSPVSNKIAEALVRRIKRAIQEEENDPSRRFKVCVVLPLLPGFEGGIEEKGSNVMRIQLSWEYSTINRGKNSIIESYFIWYYLT